MLDVLQLITLYGYDCTISIGYIYYKHFYFYTFISQNKEGNICDPGPQKQY